MKLTKTSLLCMGLMALMFAVSPEAFAQVESEGKTVGEMAVSIKDSLENVSGLAEAIAYVSGFFMGLGSLFKFKAYRDNPQQTPLGTPITWLGIAVFLIFLPELFGSGAQTLWGDGATQVDPW